MSGHKYGASATEERIHMEFSLYWRSATSVPIFLIEVCSTGEVGGDERDDVLRRRRAHVLHVL